MRSGCRRWPEPRGPLLQPLTYTIFPSSRYFHRAGNGRTLRLRMPRFRAYLLQELRDHPCVATPRNVIEFWSWKCRAAWESRAGIMLQPKLPDKGGTVLPARLLFALPRQLWRLGVISSPVRQF